MTIYILRGAEDDTDDSDSETPSPDEVFKDLYAHFGLAYFFSECIYRGLMNCIVYMTADRRTPTASIDEHFLRLENLTLGELSQQAKPHLPHALHEAIDWLVPYRNYLAHGFWFYHNYKMHSAEDAAEIVEELKENIERMRAINTALDDVCFHRLDKFQIPRSAIQDLTNRCAEIRPDPVPVRRLLKTEERVSITKVFLKQVTERRGALIFQDVDGHLWQLADKGLSWCFLDPQKESLKEFPPVQRHLPASVVGRPRGAQPWNYKLHFSTDVLLCVSTEPDDTLRFRVEQVRKESPKNG